MARILAVKIVFYPQYNMYSADSTGMTSIPEFYSVIDYDNFTAPSSLADITGYSTLKRTVFNKPHKRYFKPKPKLLGTAISATTTGIITSNRNWYDIHSNDLIYYGLRYVITAGDTNKLPAQVIRVSRTYYYQCKQII